MNHRTWHRNIALILPLLLVNAAAVWGQAGWAFDHLGRSLVIACLFALAVESIGVFLAAEAHAALMAGHASGTLRLGSYAVGALVGTLNYAHFASPGYRPNPLAVTFGLLSSISPWLWAIRSRSINRVRLYELGLIDPRAVKFSRLRWALYPVRTFGAFRAAVWHGIQRPDAAIAAADQRRAERRGVHIVDTPVLAVASVEPATERPAAATTWAQLPREVMAEVRAELPSAESAKRVPTTGGTSTRKSTAKKRGSRRGSSPRRSAEETRRLAAELRTGQPDITRAEIAAKLGIGTARLRQVERGINGTEVTAP